MIPIPKSKPQATRQLVLAKAALAWAQEYSIKPPPAIFVLAVRGYYANSLGGPGNDLGMYDDAFFIVDAKSMSAWNGNTDPSRYGLRPEGGRHMARLKTGCWWFRPLTHRRKYQAFGQGSSPVTVERIKSDGSIAITESGQFGINLHRGGINGTSSEGCCTLPPDQWEDFRSELNRVLSLAGLNKFSFLLIDGPIN